MGSAGRWRGQPGRRLTAFYRLTAISLYEAMFFNSFAWEDFAAGLPPHDRFDRFDRLDRLTS